MYRLAALFALTSVACFQGVVIETPNEERMERELAAPKGPIPPPVAFTAEQPREAEDDDFLEAEEPRYTGRWDATSYPWGFPVYTNDNELPQVRSNALTNPQGMPGGSRPGLLP